MVTFSGCFKRGCHLGQVELVVSLLVPGVVFGGFRKVLGQFSFATDWTLQAKAALRVIKDGGSA